MKLPLLLLFSLLLTLSSLAQSGYEEDFSSSTNRGDYFSDCWGFAGASIKSSGGINGNSARTSQLSNPDGTALVRTPTLEAGIRPVVSFSHKVDNLNGAAFRRMFLVLHDPTGEVESDTVYQYDYVDGSVQNESIVLDTTGFFCVEWRWQGSGGSSRGWIDDIEITNVDVVATEGNGCASRPATFPVEWLDLGAEWTAQGTRLTWQTASEQHSDHFAIERKVDQGEFETVGVVAAAGNSSEVLSYEYRDQASTTLQAEKMIYRLRQVDFDGTFSYSRLMQVQPTSSAGLRFYPNPAQDYLTLELGAGLQASHVSITNQVGATVWQTHGLTSTTLTLSIQSWPQGLYLVRTEVGPQRFVQKLLVQ